MSNTVNGNVAGILLMLSGALGIGVGILAGRTSEKSSLELAPQKAFETTIWNTDANSDRRLELFEVLNSFSANGKLSDESLQQAEKIAEEYKSTAGNMNQISEDIFKAVKIYREQQLKTE